MDWFLVGTVFFICVIIGCVTMRFLPSVPAHIPSSFEVQEYVDGWGSQVEDGLVGFIVKRVPIDATKSIINRVIKEKPLDSNDVVVKCVSKKLPNDLAVMMETRQNDLLPWDHDVTECSATGLPYNEFSMYQNVYDTSAEVVIY